MKNRLDYDVIIIGAGIGGLVCGCYLAKAGLKTLIVEKNTKVGGYCISFTAKDFTFDSCVHSLGSCGKEGIINNILKELEIYDRIKIIRANPSDIVVSPDFKFSFWNSLDKTIKELQDLFPKEAIKIRDFFVYLNNANGRLLTELRSKTFKYVLDNHFSDNKLKSLLSIFILGNMGLPASQISAFTAIKFYKQFMIDGGYYPDKGMQAFSDIFAIRFKEFEGKLLLSKMVKSIKVNANKEAEGVILDNGNFLSSRYVISDCDAIQTFVAMIGEKVLGKSLINELAVLKPSLSMFILYLGVDINHLALPKANINIWSLPNYDLEKVYAATTSGDIYKLEHFLIRVMPDKKSIFMLVNAPFNDEAYWSTNRTKLGEFFTKKIEKLIPDLSKNIIFKNSATPITLYRQTSNYKGAAYGWACIPSQFVVGDFARTTLIKNLYLTGHWATLAQGISGVAYLGRDTAKLIYDKIKNNL
ncbi:MAG: NAD(P)/FAD-dependent oxidoreductase [Candidatus Omnitrophica bacterium]|nr:NAD(P)/FAD-dependent oxidoreductase [Candidatus Omnitrophota bacterium]